MTKEKIEIRNKGILAQMQKQNWAMEPKALDAFLRSIAGLELFEANYEQAARHTVHVSTMIIQDDVAVISISGYLMKTVPSIFRDYEIDATGYDEILADLATALENENVETIILNIDSPGGMIAGIEPVLDAILAGRKQKTIIAKVDDLAASGAYWLASQAETITANSLAEIGSIGVYTVYVDSTKLYQEVGFDVIIIRSGEHKGMGMSGVPITDNQVKAVQEVIDGLCDKFIDSIAVGRNMKPEIVRELATGRVWLAEPAQALGLIDGIDSENQGGENNQNNTTVSKVSKKEKKEMSEPNEADKLAQEAAKELTGKDNPVPPATQSVPAEGPKAASLADLKAKFGTRPAFVIDQLEQGATIDQAEVAFLKLENSELKAQAEEKDKSAASGTDSVGFSGSEPEGNFEDLVNAYQKENKCSYGEAMKAMGEQNPELADKYAGLAK